MASLRRVPKPPAKMTAFIMLDRLLKVNNRKLLAGIDKVTDRTDHVVEHDTGHARIDTDPEGMIHNVISTFQIADYAVALTRGAHFIKGGMLQKIARKQVACLDLPALQVLGKVVTGEARIFLHRDKETEPSRVGILLRFGKDKAGYTRKAFFQVGEVRPPGFDNGVQFLKLGTADGGLHIGHFQVIPEMGINIFMVVTYRKVAKLFAETIFARVVNAPDTPAVTAPVTERVHQFVQQRIIGIDSTALTHRHVVRRIETARADMANRTRFLFHTADCISRAKGIAIILYQPEVMFITEIFDSLQIKRVTQRVSNHYRFSFGR